MLNKKVLISLFLIIWVSITYLAFTGGMGAFISMLASILYENSYNNLRFGQQLTIAHEKVYEGNLKEVFITCKHIPLSTYYSIYLNTQNINSSQRTENILIAHKDTLQDCNEYKIKKITYNEVTNSYRILFQNDTETSISN